MAAQTRNIALLPGFALHLDSGRHTSRLRLAWAGWRARMREAAALRRLAQEDPRTLADLGLSRSQAAFDADHSWRHGLLR